MTYVELRERMCRGRIMGQRVNAYYQYQTVCHDKVQRIVGHRVWTPVWREVLTLHSQEAARDILTAGL